MNLVEILSKELKDKHFTELEKMRYIYLRTCEIFSYDERYFTSKVLGDEELHLSLASSVADITNIDTTQVVCFKYADILDSLLESLTNVESSLMQNPWHAYVEAKINDTTYVLDGCMKDFTRVKMNLNTEYFYIANKKYKIGDYLKDIDESLGYRYNNEEEMISSLKDKSNNVKELFENINKLLSISKCNKYFFDAHYFIKFLNDIKITSHKYAKDNYDSYELYNLIESYFLLDKLNDTYELQEINKDEYHRLSCKLKEY